MARGTRHGNVEAAVGLNGAESEFVEPFQAWAVLEPRRAARVVTQRQAMERGAAAGFEVRFVPHHCAIPRVAPLSNRSAFFSPGFPSAHGWGRHCL